MFRKAAYLAHRRPPGRVLSASPPRAWLLTALIVALIASCAMLLFQGEYGRSKRVYGVLVPSSGLLQVYAPSTLTVVDVLCKEGEQVAAGEPLLRLRGAGVEAEGHNADTRRIELLDRRIQLVRRRLALAKRDSASASRRLERQMYGVRQELVAANSQADRQRLIIESLSQESGRLNALVRRRLISQSVFEERRRSLLSSEVALQSSLAAVAQVRARLEELKARQEAQDARFEGQQMALGGELLELETERLRILRDSQLSIVAPRSGTVQALHVHAGQLVAPGRPVLTLFPKGAELQAELYVPGGAIGSISHATQLKLVYDAFPFDRHGGFTATVSEITYTLLSPGDLDTPLPLREPVYRVRATLEAQTLRAGSREFQLQPGMPFSTVLMSESRSMIDWLTRPFARVLAMYLR